MTQKKAGGAGLRIKYQRPVTLPFLPGVLLTLVGLCSFISESKSQTWTHYDTSNSGLANNSVLSLTFDTAGTLWVCYKNPGSAPSTGYGLTEFDGSTWTTFTNTNSGLVANDPATVFTDAQNKKWIAYGLVNASSVPVSIYDNTTWNSLTTQTMLIGVGTGNQTVKSIAASPSGKLWFGTNGNGLRSFDGTNWTAFSTTSTGNNLKSNWVSSVSVDLSNNKWIGYGTWSGISKYNDTSWTDFNVNNSGLSVNYVSKLYADPQNSIWFIHSTVGYGVDRFDGSTWTNFNDANSGLAQNMVKDVVSDGIGNLWFGTEGGVSKFDGQNWVSFNEANTNHQLGSNYINCLAVDNQNKIWIGTDFGIYVLDPTTTNGVLEIEKEHQSLQIYPNPTKDLITITRKITETMTYRLIDLTGRAIQTGNVEGKNTILDLSSLPQGMYLFQCGRITEKIFKQ